MEEFIEKDGKKLRYGYTTGSCAAAAAKAAAWMLLTGKRKNTISLVTPKGIPLSLQVEDIRMEEDFVSCAIRKDSGDDPDVTNGTLVYARVSRRGTPEITIDGGFGVGRVTKKGLDQPVGNAAINSVPRKMIRENLEEVLSLTDADCGLDVLISVPDGERLAKQTFNPRLGIVGGISVLGTTGIVEPMSEKALVDTIRVELNQRRAGGADYVLLTPGNYGCDFIRAEPAAGMGGTDLQFHRSEPGHLPGAGIPGGAPGGTHRKAGESWRRNAEHPLQIRGLPDGDSGGSRRKGRAAPGKNRGNSGLCSLRRCPADFTGGRLPGESSG